MKKKVLSIGLMSLIAMVLVLSLALLVPVTTATAVTGGGQIYLGENATFNFDGGTISGGNAENGGGVFLSSGVTMNMTDGEISGNKATNGGGVYFDAGSDTTFTMDGGTISNNTATEQGGGVYMYDYCIGTFIMNKGSITGNTAKVGGGVYLSDASTFILNGGTISGNTAEEGSAIGLFESRLELRGGTIGGTIEGSGYVYYYDCTFTSGYIGDVDTLTICKAPTKDIPIKCDLSVGTIVATLDSGVSATTTLLSHIKVQNLPDDMELKFDGSDIVLAKKVRTVTFSVNNSSYGSVSPSSVEVPSGSTYSVSSNVMTFRNNGEIVATVTATPTTDTAEFDYSFTGWSSNSGTITENTSITASFDRATQMYEVSFSVSPSSSYGSVSTSSVTVPYGTQYSTSSNKLTFSNGSTASVTATPGNTTAQYSYYFSSWSSQSGTITSAKTITATFGRSTRTYTVSFAVSPGSSYGKVSQSSVTVPYGTTWSTSGSTLTFANGNTTSVTASPTTTDDYYNYSFSGWSDSEGTVTGPTTITATFSRSARATHTVTFLVMNSVYGSLSSTASLTVPRGTMASVSGNTITFYGPNSGNSVGSRTATPKTADTDYVYTFEGYTTGSSSSAFNNLTIMSDVTIRATFGMKQKFTVTFQCTTLGVVTDEPIEGPTFANEWEISPMVAMYRVSPSSLKVASGTTYQANGSTMEFSDGQSALALGGKVGAYQYEFSSWSPSSGTVTADTTITARFGRQSQFQPDPGLAMPPDNQPTSQETPFIDKRRGEYINVVNTYYKQYMNYDICYPI